MEKNIEFKLHQHYNDQFPWRTIKHDETHWSVTRIESEILYEDVKDEIEKVIDVSVFSDEDLQDEATGQLKIKQYQKLIKRDEYRTNWGVLFNLYSKTSRVTSEINLIWLKMSLN